MKYDKELYLDNEIYGCGKEINKGDHAVYETGFMFGEPASTYTCIECMEEWMKEIGRVESGCDTE